jgi:hypothetical protein
MLGPAVRFDDPNDDTAPSPQRRECQAILRQAIETCRPTGESWSAVMRETPDGSLMTCEFSHGTDTPRSFTFQPEGDDATHSGGFRTGLSFWVYWARGIAQSSRVRVQRYFVGTRCFSSSCQLRMTIMRVGGFRSADGFSLTIRNRRPSGATS